MRPRGFRLRISSRPAPQERQGDDRLAYRSHHHLVESRGEHFGTLVIWLYNGNDGTRQSNQDSRQPDRCMIQSRHLGIIGHLTKDYHFPNATFTSEGTRVTLHYDGRQFGVESDDAVSPGAKVTVKFLPRALLGNPGSICYGGGGFNSLLALSGYSEAKIRYVDACRLDGDIEQYLAHINTVEARSLDLRSIPQNAIVGDRSSKIILKSRIKSKGRDLDLQQMAIIEWLADSRGVLVNSPKDQNVVEALLTRTQSKGSRVHLVAPRSLPLNFLRGLVLPHIHSLIGNWDQPNEFGEGGTLEKSVDDCVRQLGYLRQAAPRLIVFITLGAEGVLVSSPFESAVYHIKLRPEVWLEVQEFARNPVRRCGCGDAFAAGAFVRIEAVPDSGAGRADAPVLAALSGCMSALAWLGFARRLGPGDFVVAPCGVLGAFAVNSSGAGSRGVATSSGVRSEGIVATDEVDEVVAAVEYDTAHERGVPHRSVHIEVTDGLGRFLIWRRSDDGRLEIPGGHVRWIDEVNKPESYEEAGLRELVEELNLEQNWACSFELAQSRLAVAIRPLSKVINQLPGTDRNNNEWVLVFSLMWNAEWGDPSAFTLGSEAESPRWLTLKEITEISVRSPTGINAALRLFLQRRGILIPLLWSNSAPDGGAVTVDD